MCRQGNVRGRFSRAFVWRFCQDNYVYSPADSICVSCTAHVQRAVLIVAAIITITVAACLIYFEFITIPDMLKRNYIIGSLYKVDGGTLRVAYSTYQITSSVAWTSEFVLPEPFAKMLQVMSIFSLDFLDLSCVRNAGSFTTVIAWSFIPVGLEVLCLLLCVIQRARARTLVESKEILRQHSSFFFVTTYIVMPPICRYQFQALDCIDIAGNKYLCANTTVDCDSARYS